MGDRFHKEARPVEVCSTMSIGSVQFHPPFAAKSSSVGRTGKNNSGWVLNFPKSHKLSRTLCLGIGKVGLSQISNGVGDKDGIIIVDHGSRRKESNLMLNEFVTMFRDKTGYNIVEAAHMELAEPSIRDSFCKCVQQGAIRVIVSPFFLLPGRHWHQDIPSLTAEAAKEHPGVPYIITAPLGLHELLVNVVDDRIKHCLSHVAGDADECDVCAGTVVC
ncbi:sirohydrochlorin ferrochelatase, chloroplastic isoform X2 [Humulus lupulus]|uniref:sirohydrochlorin ferrochelatase, chloroplastic isoform X2 n=1 Tax=Humulus lupulus TaxID=3486 RepID=UPI002B412A67|nr:sirohydrochlorin ferrochelatase, chloroplastic isoform X2 [Humulus lupulus]